MLGLGIGLGLYQRPRGGGAPPPLAAYVLDDPVLAWDPAIPNRLVIVSAPVWGGHPPPVATFRRFQRDGGTEDWVNAGPGYSLDVTPLPGEQFRWFEEASNASGGDTAWSNTLEALWTPAQAANVLAWWDYQGIEGGATVTSVPDRSGNGRTLTPIDAAFAPIMTHGGGNRWLQRPASATQGGMQLPATVSAKYVLIYLQHGTGVEATPAAAGLSGDSQRAVIHAASVAADRISLLENSAATVAPPNFVNSRNGEPWGVSILPLPYQEVETRLDNSAAFNLLSFGGTANIAGRHWRFPYLPLAVFSEVPDEETRANLRAWADRVASV